MDGHQADMSRESILIVDDVPANLRLLSQMLTKHGYKVRAVTSGPRALEAVRANPPDLILLDIMMPGMSGYEVCKRLKADGQTSDIPIIFISALDATEDKVQAFTAGGVDYVTKPFQPEEVLARVETHLALQEMQQSLQQEIAELDAYAHTVAHDLKNPLGLIAGYAEFLALSCEAMSKEELRENAQRIVHGAHRMVGIVDNLLLLASTRRRNVKMVPLDMANIMTEAQGRLAHIVEEHQAVVTVPETWPVALGYAPWVEEVWANYLSNAIKYGGQPPRVEVGASDQGDGSVRFWVRDNGPGLSPEQQRRLFAPFERLGRTRAKGHGLGLSIVLRIVEKLGGQVGVESGGVPGQGSIFFFTLPCAESA